MYRKKLLFSALVAVILLFVAALPAAQAAPPPPTPANDPSVVDVAIAINEDTGEFSTLIAALQAANLVGPLDRKGKVTVFAPTDAAFAELGLDAGNIGDLDRRMLTSILLYHVTPGNRLSQSVAGADQIRMANGQFTDVSASDAGVFINDAQILTLDVLAGNGVIHVIDGVLMP
jgi:uncharacterized surface protein with fasciclin (FAS1) repeats